MFTQDFSGIFNNSFVFTGNVLHLHNAVAATLRLRHLPEVPRDDTRARKNPNPRKAKPSTAKETEDPRAGVAAEAEIVKEIVETEDIDRIIR